VYRSSPANQVNEMKNETGACVQDFLKEALFRECGFFCGTQGNGLNGIAKPTFQIKTFAKNRKKSSLRYWINL